MSPTVRLKCGHWGCPKIEVTFPLGTSERRVRAVCLRLAAACEERLEGMSAPVVWDTWKLACSVEILPVDAADLERAHDVARAAIAQVKASNLSTPAK